GPIGLGNFRQKFDLRVVQFGQPAVWKPPAVIPAVASKCPAEGSRDGTMSPRLPVLVKARCIQKRQTPPRATADARPETQVANPLTLDPVLIRQDPSRNVERGVIPDILAVLTFHGALVIQDLSRCKESQDLPLGHSPARTLPKSKRSASEKCPAPWRRLSS